MPISRPPFFLSLFLLGVTALLRASETVPPRPNIIVIMADDLGYSSLGCYGNKQIKTPHIDALAASGVRLMDFHSNGAMCTPTRAALMTGRYQQRCAWVDDEELSPIYHQQRKENPAQRWAWGISPEEWTMPKMLAKAGYRSALIGKWHLGYDVKFHPLRYGFDEFRGFVGGGVDYHKHIATHGLKELDWWNQQKISNEKGYTTDLLTRYAVEFLDRHVTEQATAAAAARPFFLYLAHAAPHSPWQTRDADSRKSSADLYREMIETLDESVGSILKCLQKHQIMKHTLIIFCSDNGPQAPRGFSACTPWQGKKGSMLEGGHRVPCIASWPGIIPTGQTSNEVVMTMDFLPTFAKLAGTEMPTGHVLDGSDVMPSFKKETALPERALHWRHGAQWAVRKGSWKLLGTGKTARTLVNLATDPSEKINLLEKHPRHVKELLDLHLRWVAEVGAK